MRIFQSTKTVLSALLYGRINDILKVPESESSSSSTRMSASGEASSPTQNSASCGLWLAPSTIPGAGLGMFAGRDFSEGEYLQQDDGDLVIPLVDLKEHAQQFKDGDWKFLWDEYTWDAESLYMSQEGLYEVNVASPGFGAAANCFLDLDNVEEWYPKHSYLGLHRGSDDPGVGGFTPYHGRRSSAKIDIKAGDELFVTYGDHWFEARAETIGYVPLNGDLEKATELARTYLKLREETNVPEPILKEIWIEFVTRSKFNQSHVLSAFRSDDLHELDKLEKESLIEIRRKQSHRSPEWLEQYGTCGDNIKPQPSLLPQAGRGGFASRFLPKGTVVAQLPLIHITERDRLNIWHFNVDENGHMYPDKSQGLQGKQLLLNYCFGHNESSLLLCPYGPMASYVNHNRTLANVEIRWADPARGNQMAELLEEPISRLDSDATAKLAFELIAKRDILPGEELYLDYGLEWEEAWTRHVAGFSSSAAAKDYIPAWQLNEDRTTRLKTEFEQLAGEKIPANLEVRCDMTVHHSDDWMDYSNENLLQYLSERNGRLVACEILRYERIDDKWFYTVVMMELDENDKSQVENHLVNNIPREAIRVVDRPYTSDIFLLNAFRHDIRIPDSIFPEAWRNLRDGQNTRHQT